MSFFQIATPFLAFGMVASTILFSFTAVLIPLANKQAEYIKNVIIQKKPQALTLGKDGLWLRFGQNALLKIDSVKEDEDGDGGYLQRLRLYRMGEDFELKEIIEAEKSDISLSKVGSRIREQTRSESQWANHCHSIWTARYEATLHTDRLSDLDGCGSEEYDTPTAG